MLLVVFFNLLTFPAKMAFEFSRRHTDSEYACKHVRFVVGTS